MEELKYFVVKYILFQGNNLEKLWGLWAYFAILILIINVFL